MKKYIFSLVMMTVFSTGVFAQISKLNQIFEKYQETEGVTSIKIAKPMFSMLSKLDIEEAELEQLKPMLNKINGLKILVIEKPKLDDQKAPDAKLVQNFSRLSQEISHAVGQLKYQELITINSSGNKIKFLAEDTSTDILDNILLSIVSNETTMYMMLEGKISMGDVSKLINESEKASTK